MVKDAKKELSGVVVGTRWDAIGPGEGTYYPRETVQLVPARGFPTSMSKSILGWRVEGDGGVEPLRQML